jgi:hypothetical protein
MHNESLVKREHPELRLQIVSRRGQTKAANRVSECNRSEGCVLASSRSLSAQIQQSVKSCSVATHVTWGT